MHLAAIRLLLLISLTFAQAQEPSKPAPTQNQQSAPAPAAAPAAPAQSAPSPQSAAGMATCYFYRPRIYRGSAVRIGIFIDTTLAINMVNGRWVALLVPAGHHIIKPKDNQNGADVDLEAGKSYYYKTEWGEAGMWHGAHKLFAPVMKEEGAYAIQQLKPLDKQDIMWPTPVSAEAAK